MAIVEVDTLSSVSFQQVHYTHFDNSVISDKRKERYLIYRSMYVEPNAIDIVNTRNKQD